MFTSFGLWSSTDKIIEVWVSNHRLIGPASQASSVCICLPSDCFIAECDSSAMQWVLRPVGVCARSLSNACRQPGNSIHCYLHFFARDCRLFSQSVSQSCVFLLFLFVCFTITSILHWKLFDYSYNCLIGSSIAHSIFDLPYNCRSQKHFTLCAYIKVLVCMCSLIFFHFSLPLDWHWICMFSLIYDYCISFPNKYLLCLKAQLSSCCPVFISFAFYLISFLPFLYLNGFLS